MPLLLYGIVRRGHPLRPPSDGPLADARLVESDALAAAAIPVDDPETLTDEAAVTHLDALIELLKDGPVLPLPFGTIAPHEAAVRSEVLDSAAGGLLRRLDAVDGLVETRLDLGFEESEAMGELVSSVPELADLVADTRAEGAGTGERIALGEAVAHLLPDWRRARTEALLTDIAPSVQQTRELDTDDPLVARLAMLVRADHLADLDAAVGRLRASVSGHVAVEYVGPLPVYSFVEPEPAPVTNPEPQSAWGW